MLIHCIVKVIFADADNFLTIGDYSGHQVELMENFDAKYFINVSDELFVG